MKLAGNLGQIGGVRGSRGAPFLSTERCDGTRLESTDPDSLVVRTGMPVPAVMGSWWDIVFGWEGGVGGEGEREW